MTFIVGVILGVLLFNAIVWCVRSSTVTPCPRCSRRWCVTSAGFGPHPYFRCLRCFIKYDSNGTRYPWKSVGIDRDENQ